uniref:Uncharacterized protein n=1 Tax=Panagrolaimus davidi TaxID=227884 RepID=A0A914QGZ3_9BILA
MENCETIIEWLEDNPDQPLDEETIDLAKQIEKDAGELIAAEGSVDYRHVRQDGKPIEPLLLELTLNAENDEQKKIFINARVELRKNVENIRNRYENHRNIPIHKMKLIMENCDEVLEWLNDNPDKPLDEEIFNLAKQTEKDAEELITHE